MGALRNMGESDYFWEGREELDRNKEHEEEWSGVKGRDRVVNDILLPL